LNGRKLTQGGRRSGAAAPNKKKGGEVQMEKGMKIKTLIFTATLSAPCDTAFQCFLQLINQPRLNQLLISILFRITTPIANSASANAGRLY
jgi:hypothetical protein